MLHNGIPAGGTAEQLGVACKSIQCWKKIPETQGIESMKAIADAGRPDQLGEADLKWLPLALREGSAAHGFSTDLWTFKRLNYSDVNVWRWLGKTRFSSQKPERQAKKRDDETVQLWRKKSWPEIKKAH